MKKTKSYLLAVFTALLLACLLCVSASAADATSGTCGDNLTWTLTDGTLTIGGSGAMADYDYRTQPWYGYRESII